MPAKKAAPKSVKSAPKKTAKTVAKKAAKKHVPAKTAAKKPPQSLPYEQGKWAHVYTRAPGEQRCWLVKSEPEAFSFQDLMNAPKRTTCWDSVRNTGARNFMRDAMKLGDLVFYYHSNAEPSAIVGICEVVREGYPDTTAFDATHPYFDAESDPKTPTWFMVDLRAVSAFDRPVSLAQIKASPALAEMALVRVSRLSIVPVTKAEWETVVAMGTSR